MSIAHRLHCVLLLLELLMGPMKFMLLYSVCMPSPKYFLPLTCQETAQIFGSVVNVLIYNHYMKACVKNNVILWDY